MFFFLRFRFLILTASLFSILWVHPLEAALLKDIRLGEYKTFTRIVFEFDQAPPAIPDTNVHPDELRVIFKDLTADLRRKIAIKQSPHVNAVQIWLEDNQLSAVFKVDAPFTHSKISSITSPPRVLVDVHWQSIVQAPKVPEAVGTRPLQSDAPSTDASALMPTPNETAAPLLPQETLQLPPDPQSGAPPTQKTLSEETVASSDLGENSSVVSKSQAPEVSVLKPPATPSKGISALPAESNAIIPPPVSNSHSNRLQYYLVIGLVVLTIIILILLVLMLLTKYRWGHTHTLFNMDDNLKEQQAKIDKINGRIKEQLKNYEKA